MYNNRDGLFDVSFAGAATVNRPLVTLQSNGHSIAWRFVTPTEVVNPSEVMSTVVVPEVASATVENDATEQENSLQAVRNIGKIRYTELLGQETEVRLTVTPLKVKEDILLESAPAQSTSYTTRLTLSAGLIPVLGEDGTVFVRDTAGVDVFRIAAPYMTDAVEEISQEIDVSLSAVGSDWELTVTPNWDWLTDSARVYPVTIDPTVYASNNATNTWDTYIYQNCTSSTAASRQDLDRMYVGNRSSASQLKCRGMVKFLTMPTIYGDITGAQLSFTTPSGTTTWKNMTLYRITESWECSTAAWPGPAATAIQSKTASNGKYTFDVTTAIKAMYYNNSTGSVGNYGFQIRYQDETVSDYNSLRSSEWWTDTEDDASKPYLAITYTAYSPCSFASGGIYHITNVASGNYLSVTNSGSTGTVLSGETANYRGNQSWKLVHVGNGVYSATPTFRVALRMNATGSADGSNVNVISSDNSDAQRWFIISNGDGTYRFVPVSGKDSNKVLQVANATAGSVSTAQIGTWSSATKQKWSITAISSQTHSGISSGKTYYIKNVATGKYLSLVSDTNATLVQVGQSAKVQNGKQRWKIIYYNGNYHLQSILGHDGTFNLNKTLEIPNGSMYTGDTPRINAHSGSAAQKFQLKQIDATTFTFFTVCSGYNTSLTADSNGIAVTTTYHSGNDYQKWVLEPAYDATQKAVSIGGEFFLESDKDYEQYADVKESSRAFDLLGYTAAHSAPTTQLQIYDLIDFSSVVHVSCHGGHNGLDFYNATVDGYDECGVYIRKDTSDEPGWYHNNAAIEDFILVDCKLMIFDSCSTYLPGDNNDICDAAVAAGANAVIGWGHDVDTGNTEWLQMFFERTMRGDTVQQAVNYINQTHHDGDSDGKCDEDDCGYFDAQVIGNGNFQLFATQ